MSKVSFVILSIVSSLLLHLLLLLPFTIVKSAEEGDDTREQVVLLTDNSPDSVELVRLDPQTLFEFESMEEDAMGMGISDARCDNARVSRRQDKVFGRII